MFLDQNQDSRRGGSKRGPGHLFKTMRLPTRNVAIFGVFPCKKAEKTRQVSTHSMFLKPNQSKSWFLRLRFLSCSFPFLSFSFMSLGFLQFYWFSFHVSISFQFLLFRFISCNFLSFSFHCFSFFFRCFSCPFHFFSWAWVCQHS